MAEFQNVTGITPLLKHGIDLENQTAIKQRYRPRNPAMQQIIDVEVQKILEDHVIRPLNSPWSSPIVLAKKKDGKSRFCVDFRRLNLVTHKDAYPLSQVNASLKKLKGAKYLSTIDLKNGYWQIELIERSKPLTAFIVPDRGLFEFNSFRSVYIQPPPHFNDS